MLPFKFTGSNTEVATLAEGLSEEIVTGLSRFSYLRVISRSSTLRYASETDDVRAVGKTLGARYVMEGSLRLAGSMLRVAVQLVDCEQRARICGLRRMIVSFVRKTFSRCRMIWCRASSQPSRISMARWCIA